MLMVTILDREAIECFHHCRKFCRAVLFWNNSEPLVLLQKKLSPEKGFAQTHNVSQF